MGTLFERALDASQRSQLGAHYTSETDIKTLVEPVLMSPLRREWSEIKSEFVGVEVTRLKLSGKKKNETPHVVSYKPQIKKPPQFALRRLLNSLALSRKLARL